MSMLMLMSVNFAVDNFDRKEYVAKKPDLCYTNGREETGVLTSANQSYWK